MGQPLRQLYVEERVGLQLALPFMPETGAPFVKWVGGKSRLLPQLDRLLPQGVEGMRHLEPFLGGAAMFFARRPARAVLSDKNVHLCTTYEVVRDDVEALIVQLRVLAAHHGAERYYALRERYNHAALDRWERAALFIYLNKTCYNGLHRVNRRGEFNVPIGRYTKPRILDEEGLRAASRGLRGAQLRCGSFELVLEHAQTGDFVYFDPPYVPVSRTSSFTAYAAGGFTLDEQRRLRDVFRELDKRGCFVMLSNSAAPEVRALYAGYRLDIVSTSRSINCAPHARGPVDELVVRNYCAASIREEIGSREWMGRVEGSLSRVACA